MKISAKQYAISLYDLVAGRSEKEAAALIKRFVAYLAEQRALNLAGAIGDNFQAIWEERQGELSVELSSARPLVPAVKTAILDYLRTQTGTQAINCQEKIDPTLLGGFLANYRGRRLDGSLRRRLEQLQTKISN